MSRTTKLTALLAGAAILLGAPARSAADPTDPRAVAEYVARALSIGKGAMVVAVMDSNVAFDLEAPGCDPPLRRPGRATGKTRPALATCLVSLARGQAILRLEGSATAPMHVDVTFAGGTLGLELRAVKDHLRVAAVRFAGNAGAARAGAGAGSDGGPGGSELDAPAPLPPPPSVVNVAPKDLDVHRISGNLHIYPDDDTRMAILASGKTSFLVPVKVCIDVDGNVSTVKLLRSSGFRAYDRDLVREIHAWRYTPYLVNGTPAPACGMVNFSYRQT